MYIFDNDIYTIHFVRESSPPILEQRVANTDPALLYISIIAAAESIQGSFNIIKKHWNTEKVILGYNFLAKMVHAIKTYQVLTFDEKAYLEFKKIPLEVCRKIGMRDSRIAATALAHDFTVITRNVQHFSLVPKLKHEDWTKP